jgi:hypothetical protein
MEPPPPARTLTLGTDVTSKGSMMIRGRVPPVSLLTPPLRPRLSVPRSVQVERCSGSLLTSPIWPPAGCSHQPEYEYEQNSAWRHCSTPTFAPVILARLVGGRALLGGDLGKVAKRPQKGGMDTLRAARVAY